jgi:hypothetical protein
MALIATRNHSLTALQTHTFSMFLNFKLTGSYDAYPIIPLSKISARTSKEFANLILSTLTKIPPVK